MASTLGAHAGVPAKLPMVWPIYFMLGVASFAKLAAQCAFQRQPITSGTFGHGFVSRLRGSFGCTGGTHSKEQGSKGGKAAAVGGLNSKDR